jgi:hypothetical protein
MPALRRKFCFAIFVLMVAGCAWGQTKTETTQAKSRAYLKLTTPQRVLPDAQPWEGDEFPHTLSVLEVKRGGFRYWGWYGLNEGRGIGLVRSNDLVHWTKYEQNPLVDAEIGYGRYYFSDDWKVADRDGDSKQSEYGLDLEASWLLVEAAEQAGRGQDPKIRHASLALVDHALRDGFDKEHGGVYNNGPAAGPASDKNMEWWQQMEALVALLNAYRLTDNLKYW